MHIILNNWSLKLISIMLAVLLWIHVGGEVNPLETMSVDVPFKVHAPRDILLMNERSLPDQVTVLLRGPRLSLRNIKGGSLVNSLSPMEPVRNVAASGVRAEIDFSHVRGGVQDVPVKAQSLIPDIDVMGVKPANVTISTDHAQELHFTLQPRFAKELQESFMISGISTKPPTVEAFGPSNVLKRIVQIRAVISAGNGTAGTQSVQIPLVAVDRDGGVVRGVRLSSNAALATFTLNDKTMTRKVPITAELSGTPASGYEVTAIEVLPQAIELEGSKRILTPVTKLEVPMDVAGESGTVRRRVKVDLVSGLRASSGPNPTVRVTVRMRRIGAEGSGTNDSEAAGTNNRVSGSDPGNYQLPPPVRHGE